jgi:hypothetical protein
MNLNALADRPAVSALPQRVRLYPDRELMGLFERDTKYGARPARAPAQNAAASFKLAHYRTMTHMTHMTRFPIECHERA